MPEIGLNYYPFASPIVLTDVLFEEYGGNAANSSKTQRQAAYWMAEEKASEDIGTLLAKTTVTGTYHFATRLMLEHGNVHQVMLTRFVDFKEDVYYTISGTANIYAGIDNFKLGVIDLPLLVNNCHCASPSWRNLAPYNVQIVYEAGLPSGTAYAHNTLLGLTTYAQIILNEIVGFGNEGAGDVGITEFSNQQYSEKRKIMNTVYGSSPRLSLHTRC